jgi:hypothetical protein
MEWGRCPGPDVPGAQPGPRRPLRPSAGETADGAIDRGGDRRCCPPFAKGALRGFNVGAGLLVIGMQVPRLCGAGRRERIVPRAARGSPPAPARHEPGKPGARLDEELERRPVNLLVLDPERSWMMDVSGAEMIRELQDALAGRGIAVRIAGARAPIVRFLAEGGPARFPMPGRSAARVVRDWRRSPPER